MRNRRSNFLKIMILLCSFLLGSIWLMSAQGLSVPPDFSLVEVKSGMVIRLYDYSNKVILLNFMTTWCPWDAKEFDDVLVPLYENYYKNDVNVVFITIHLDPQTSPDIQSYAKEHNINWPILEGGKWSDSKVAADYGVDAVPTTFIIKCSGNIREIIYYKRGYDPESLNKFYQVIESAKQEILMGKSQTETRQQAVNVFSYQNIIHLPNGAATTINLTTTSEIAEDLTLDSSNNRLYLRVNEHSEKGFLAIYIPKEFLEAHQSSINKLTTILDDKEATPNIRSEENGNLLQIEYECGQHKIDIYYQTFSLTVNIQSIFGLPVSSVTVVLEWPDGKPFKTVTTTSSGTATFTKVPSLNASYTLYVQQGPLSFQYVPQQLKINQDAQASLTSYIHYDTCAALAFLLIIGTASWKIQKSRKSKEEEKKNKTEDSTKQSEAETNV